MNTKITITSKDKKNISDIKLQIGDIVRGKNEWEVAMLVSTGNTTTPYVLISLINGGYYQLPFKTRPLLSELIKGYDWELVENVEIILK